MNVLSRSLLVFLSCLLPLTVLQAETITVGGVGGLTPLMQKLAEAFMQKNPAHTVTVMTPPLGTGGGIRALNDGRIDLAMSGRPLKAGENGRSIPWLQTPLVLATQGGVLAKGLDEQTIADIYAGRRTQWDNGKPVRLVLRGAEETELKILRFLSREVDVAVGTALKRTDLPVGENDLEALALLARINGSIGTTTLGLLRAQGEQIKPLSLNGVSPSLENMNKKNYPLLIRPVEV